MHFAICDTICKLTKHLSKMSLSTCLFALETFWWIKFSWIEFQISKFHEQLSNFVAFSFCFASVERERRAAYSLRNYEFRPGITFIFYTLISHFCSYFIDLLSFFYCDTQQWTENFHIIRFYSLTTFYSQYFYCIIIHILRWSIFILLFLSISISLG